MAEEILIRPCRPEDVEGVSEVCCRCGFAGEEIGQSQRFRDRHLFAMLFSRYYLRYEQGSCYVAVPAREPGRVVGYVLGCPDTARYDRLFARAMVPRIAARVFLVTWWRYPSTLRELLRWQAGNPWKSANPAGPEYPAHLHIDLLPEYQRQGIGGRMLETLEARFLELGLPGIHLVTSNHHAKSLPFYEKHGYLRHRVVQHEMWSDFTDYASVVYTKRLVP